MPGGEQRALPRSIRAADPVPADTVIEATLVLRRRAGLPDPAGIAPTSRAQFAADYGADPADVELVTATVTALGARRPARSRRPPAWSRSGRSGRGRPADRLPGPGRWHRHRDRRNQCGGSAVGGAGDALGQAAQRRLGLLQPALYDVSRGFRDITTGSNGAFAAGPGWDPCTGLGVPDGAGLLAALRQHSRSPE